MKTAVTKERARGVPHYRFAVAVITCLSLVPISVSIVLSASGATIVRQWGRHGRSILRDTGSQPGATCQYSDGRLAEVTVKAPTAWPRRAYLDKVANQYVGWVPVLERQASNGEWDPYGRPPSLETFRRSFRRYERKRLGDPYTFESLPPGSYRATVKVQWFEEAKVAGGTTFEVDNYGESDDTGFCSAAVSTSPSASPSPPTSPSPSATPTPTPTPAPSPTGGSALWWGVSTRPAFGSDTTRVATLRGLEPVVGDFDGDGRGDIFWYSSSGSGNVWWGRSDRSFTTGSQIPVAANLRPTVGDFDGDGLDDIFWYGLANVPDSLWWSVPGRAWQEDNAYQVGSSWDQVLAGDYNGDGFSDLYFYRNSAKTQECANTLSQIYWWGNADRSKLTANQTTATTTKCYYKFYEADVDGNGIDDLLGYGQSPNPRDSITFHDRFQPSGPIAGEAFSFDQPYGFRPVLGDFDGDTRADTFWFSPAGADSQWWGSSVRADYKTFVTHIEVNGDYFPVSGDFDGDGKDDTLWYER